MATPIRDGVVPWPADVARAYVEAGYWLGRPLGALLREAADRTPGALALVDGDGVDAPSAGAAGVRLTHGELLDRADAMAARLVDLGLEPGDRIVVQLPNRWEFVVLTLACLRAGIVPVMALPAHRRAELAHLAAHAEAAAIAVPDRLREFNHQALAAQLVAAVAPLRHVLVAGERVADGHVDLRTLGAPGSAVSMRRRSTW
ncbi:AMP-binding protein [Pseudonocardia asaccharolytica]|uniref:AMP-dependent synthetase/ligase domain-containing protein n=1 Tax=Pseudonocardia asaccharolytica DSM 44247 = NBRC 16224 TaxID=1123024 RepID=A0A511CXQ7_9PSEU|nr:AMP-binding protein [Pseudonocardia asaccharolytica]GEL17257.1 hypothetical protein PA7_10940 [Pseudonocardia asaccharolytica DSM 44247 = NBRC 16224]